MKTITKEELQKVLENHLHWLREDCDGWENMKADLSDTDLRYADLSYADLRSADMGDKIFKHYSYNIGDYKIMIVFIEK